MLFLCARGRGNVYGIYEAGGQYHVGILDIDFSGGILKYRASAVYPADFMVL